MRDDLLGYYKRELSYLRELGAEFQSKYPGVAGHLRLDRDQSDDPHVSRLLEGFAFLTARVRAKLDDSFPEITDALLGVLYPHFQRPFPSASIAQFGRRPRAESSRGGETIEAGTPLRATHPEWRDCHFRTAYPTTLWPLEVVSADLTTDRIPGGDRRRGDAALIRLTLRTDATGGVGGLGLDRLRFYLGGEDRVSYALHELLGTAATRVEVGPLPRGERTVRATLGTGAVRPVGFGPDEGLVPYPRRSPRGHLLIQEYLNFPRKFLFFDLVGLEPTARFGLATDFEVLLFFDRAPRDDLPVEARHFQLGCTPVVNLFSARSIPIRTDRTRGEYPVVPEVVGRHRPEVYSVDRVIGAGSMLERSVEYRPFYDYRHDEAGRTPPFWHARRRASTAKGVRGTEVDLAFVGEGFEAKGPSSEVVAASLTCTNRDHAVGMPIGRRAGDLEPEGLAAPGPARCLLPFSPPTWPPLGRDAQWRLISNLALNHLSLVGEAATPAAGRDALVELLTAYDFTGDEAVRDRIAGIASVSGRRALAQVPGRGACGGVEVVVSFEASKYIGASPHLLAAVLDRFLGLYVSINAFSRLVVVDDRGEVIKRWPPRIGETPLI